MTDALRRLGHAALERLADALRTGRTRPPISKGDLRRLITDKHVDDVHAELQQLVVAGMTGSHLAVVVGALAAERARQQRSKDRVQLVLSPPELDEVDARDTAVVVRDLFAKASQSVLVATYAIDSGSKAEALFGDLADRMDAEPDLDVRFYVNIHRAYGDLTPAVTLIRDFAKRFRSTVWPGDRLPEVFYDQRSVMPYAPKRLPQTSERAVLHAKCVVVDDRWALISSANFTEAAQERNVEAGVLLDDARTARRLRRQLEALVHREVFGRLPV